MTLGETAKLFRQQRLRVHRDYHLHFHRQGEVSWDSHLTRNDDDGDEHCSRSTGDESERTWSTAPVPYRVFPGSARSVIGNSARRCDWRLSATTPGPWSFRGLSAGRTGSVRTTSPSLGCGRKTDLRTLSTRRGCRHTRALGSWVPPHGHRLGRLRRRHWLSPLRRRRDLCTPVWRRALACRRVRGTDWRWTAPRGCWPGTRGPSRAAGRRGRRGSAPPPPRSRAHRAPGPPLWPQGAFLIHCASISSLLIS